MKELFTLSLLILGSLTSFADNGENEMTLKLNSISVEKPMVNESEDPPISNKYKYRIIIDVRNIAEVIYTYEDETITCMSDYEAFEYSQYLIEQRTPIWYGPGRYLVARWEIIEECLY